MQHAMRVVTVAAAMLLSPIAVDAQSTLYKVVDQYGNVTYQDTPPADDAGVRSEALEVEPPESPAAPADAAVNRDDVLAAAETRPLVLFTIPGCDTCDLLRWFLDERELPYEEVNVQNDIGNQQRLQEATGEYRVPVLMVGQAPLFGYDREDLVAELADAGYIAPEATPEADEPPTETESAADEPPTETEPAADTAATQ